MELSKTEINEINKNFSAKFSNKILGLMASSAEDDDNIAVSPSRLQALLVLLANWTSPDVRRRILDVIGSDAMEINEANALCSKEQFVTTPQEEDEHRYIPVIEQNTFLWLAKELNSSPTAIEAVQNIFDVVVKNVDFTKPETKDIIDAAVEESTHRLINGIHADIEPDTLAMITDILYFKATWEEVFDEEETKEQLFFGIKDKSKVQMMYREGCMHYGETEKCQMVRLPYMCMAEEEKYFSMRVYLPKKSYTTTDMLEEIRHKDYSIALEEEEVKLSLPRFTIQSNIRLHKILEELGLRCIFESKDIMPVFCKNLQISQIVQEVKVIVNEKETEAAAVTYMCTGGCLPPEEEPEPKVMTVNRPFIFEITEDSSNVILFTGIINNIDNE